MTNQSTKIKKLTIKNLLDRKDKYVIPIYQRNYAWGESEIVQLIQDIIDYCLLNSNNNYYLGTLVVFERKNGQHIVYETIDGQQRLTTLSILCSVIKNSFETIDLSWFETINLEFDSRRISTETLDAAHSGVFYHQTSYNDAIKDAYELITKILPLKIAENQLPTNDISIEKFCEYLFEKVQILRVPVPEDTNLNHYFEIMNNRGEQLEKHEILKSKFLEILNASEEKDKENSGNWFHVIWEACSNMEKYVQYGFTPEQRNIIFGQRDWNSLRVDNFDNIAKINLIIEQKDQNTTKLSIVEITEGRTITTSQQSLDDNPERFNSVISFPNFLLHVLRIQTQQDIPLDDKRLLKIFEEEINKTDDKIFFIKTFIFNLLKCKLLFDKYVIKREFISGTDKWSLKRLKWYEGNKVSYVNTFGEEENDNTENRTILMLLSMFHVSTPTLVYKHWLNASLNYLFASDEIKSELYIQYLEKLVKAFVFDRFLSLVQKDYFEIIYKNNSLLKNNINNLNLEYLTFGKIQNNLVFNYLDYLLWRDNTKRDSKLKNFEFTFRSSVEHYYPQNPMQGFDILEDTNLNSFGNLCLISSSKNSRLSNYMPTAKKEHYAGQNTIDSIKQYIMMNEYSSEHWKADSIEDHNNKMISILLNQFDSLNSSDSEANQTFIDEINENKVSLAFNWFNKYQIEDKILLARAIMCFGTIDYEIGWTSGGGKWNLYQWHKIIESEAYFKFAEYIETYKPNNLEEIIEFQLKNCSELRQDSYRFVFVSRPEIMMYCKEGNFGWINDGKKIILLEASRASLYCSCDLYDFCLNRYLKRKYGINSYCGSDRLKITLIENNGILKLSNINWQQDVLFEIWNNGNGQLCYEINTRNLHGNSKTIRILRENGWDYNESGRLYFVEQPYLLELSDDIESNIIEMEKRFDILVSHLE